MGIFWCGKNDFSKSEAQNGGWMEKNTPQNSSRIGFRDFLECRICGFPQFWNDRLIGWTWLHLKNHWRYKSDKSNRMVAKMTEENDLIDEECKSDKRVKAFFGHTMIIELEISRNDEIRFLLVIKKVRMLRYFFFHHEPHGPHDQTLSSSSSGSSGSSSKPGLSASSWKNKVTKGWCFAS